MTAPEIASDTDELRGQSGTLRTQADALDSALANIEALGGSVHSQAQAFVDKHQPNAVYMEKVAELGKRNSAVKAAITALSGQLRAQADGLTTHAASKDEQEGNAAANMDKLPDTEVGTPTPQPRTVPDMPSVAV